jgi:hypothetical protein
MFHLREGEVEPEDYSFVIARVAPDVMNGTRNTNAERTILVMVTPLCVMLPFEQMKKQKAILAPSCSLAILPVTSYER